MKRFRIALTLGGAALAGLFSTASTLHAAHPAAPCPCAADGTCRPKADTYGVWATHWRPWPGELAGLTPTPAQPLEADVAEDELRPLEAPTPQKEDQVGPEKQEIVPRNAVPLEALETPVGQDLRPQQGPGVEADQFDALPAIDPQGNYRPQPLPSLPVDLQNPAAARQASAVQPLLPANLAAHGNERHAAYQAKLQPQDNPPALPPTLLRVIELQGGSNHTGQAVRLPAVSSQQQRPIRHDTSVRRVVAEQPMGIRIINPAAAVTNAGDASGLQQAIYFEDSQQSRTSGGQTR